MMTPTAARRPRSFHAFCTTWSTIISILLLLSSSNNNIASSQSTDAIIPSPLPPPFSLKGAHQSWATCTSHSTCTECYQASHTCHWCAHDNACHVKGSVHTGCVTGASCTPEPDESCATHTTCGSCSSSSWGCHWCSSDEACHAVGSMHGCAAGTNCYAIDRCQRLEPERMEEGGTFSKASFHGVGPVAKGFLGLMLGLVLCCSTMCFGGAAFVKSAVDDLVGEPVEIVEDGMVVEGGGGGGQRQQYEALQTAEEGQDNELEIPLMMQNDTVEKVEDGEGGGNNGSDDGDADNNMLKSDSVLMRSEAPSVARSNTRATPSSLPRGGSSIKRMFCACQLCYLVTLFTSSILFVVGMSYAPREPQYNVCTNQIAWKSIVEGMASLKMSASFDLLISVYNPNRFEVDLSNGAGQFHHDGEYVGSFDIPEGKISEQAISDIVVKVTFTPDKWSALSLTSEYYRGNLKFVVGGHAHVKIPGLGNYQFDAKFDDINVNVNDPSLDDTHLCACPGWKKPITD